MQPYSITPWHFGHLSHTHLALSNLRNLKYLPGPHCFPLCLTYSDPENYAKLSFASLFVHKQFTQCLCTNIMKLSTLTRFWRRLSNYWYNHHNRNEAHYFKLTHDEKLSKVSLKQFREKWKAMSKYYLQLDGSIWLQLSFFCVLLPISSDRQRNL